MRVNQDSALNQANKTAQTEKASSQRTEKKDSTKTHEQASGAAALDISARAREMALAKEAAAAAPDISPERAERIAELKRRIENREYNVKPEAIADRMVKEHLKTHGLG